MSRTPYNQTQTEIKTAQIVEQKIKDEASTAPTFCNVWVSDLGADAHCFSKDKNFLSSKDENLFYCTSNGAKQAWKGQTSDMIFTRDLNPNLNDGSGRVIGNGNQHVMVAKSTIETKVGESTADILMVILGAGGASSFPFLMLLIQLFFKMYPETSSFAKDDFDFDFEGETSVTQSAPCFVATILAPSEGKEAQEEWSIYERCMEKIPKACSYQLLKVDNITASGNGKNTREQNLAACANQQALAKKIIHDMTELRSSQGTNIDQSEVQRVLKAGGEIFINKGTGHDMVKALEDFEVNIKTNNSKANILGARDILVKFLYPNTQYTEEMASLEEQVKLRLSKSATGNITPMIKDSIVLGCSVTHPTIMVMAGGVPNENDRGAMEKSKTNYKNNSTIDFINNGLVKNYEPTKLELAFKATNTEMTRPLESYSSYLGKPIESINNSQKLSDGEKQALSYYQSNN
jgi:hypothetical protein